MANLGVTICRRDAMILKFWHKIGKKSFFPIFCIFFWIFPDYKLSKSHSNCHLASGGAWNVKIIESPLPIWARRADLIKYFFQIVVCLIGSFCGMFLQSALETMFSPMAKRLLGFTAVENSITYVCIGVIAVAGYARKVFPRR